MLCISVSCTKKKTARKEVKEKMTSKKPKNETPYLNKQKIIKTIAMHRGDISRFGARKIGLFGSFAKGMQHKKSDIDFLVVFEKKTFDNYMELKFFLERLFKKKVDLVIEENLRPEFKYVRREVSYVRIL